MSDASDNMLKRINDGEMKIVMAKVLMVVPAVISLDSVAANAREGVSFIIDEHLFRNIDIIEEDNIVDDVTLLEVSCEDVRKV